MDIISAFTGAVLGASIDPVLWAAVAAVVYFGRTTRSFFVSLAIAFAALFGCWIVLGTLDEYLVDTWLLSAIPSVVALVMWASLGRVIRHVISLRRAHS